MMTYSGFKFASGQRGRKTTMQWGGDEHKGSYVPPYGTELFVGPKGAGKSLLSVHRARYYRQGLKRMADGRCVCGDVECDGVWQVYTNLESPTRKEYGAWAHPLDLARDMVDAESNARHVIFLIDEITQMFNSRRSMMSEVIQIIHRVTLIRKNLVQLWGTGISYDWLDVRIRDQASMLYNCWTTNQGATVMANVHQLAVGHLPPNKRRQRPRLKWWNTDSTKRYYNHEETINFAAELATLRTEPSVFVQRPDGSTVEMQFTEILTDELIPLLKAGVNSVTVDQMMEQIKTRYNLDMGRPYIRDFYIQSGFPNDGQGNYTIMTKGPEDDGLDN